MRGKTKPLDGVKVLDLTRYLAGPYCTMLLGGLGAEVIKVETPGTGDFYRDRAPYAGPEGVSLKRRTASDLGLGIIHRSRNKKSITLNLRDPEGLEIFRSLVKNVDVVVENYSPGVMEAMGCDYETLKSLNPKIILCSISGFGQTGPLRDWRAFDTVAQAMSGIMSITGFESNPPVRCGAAIADTVAPLVAAMGVLAALLRRGITGEGEWVDVAMLDVLAFLLPEVVEYYQADMIDFPLGNRHPGGVPFNTFETRDGYVCIATVMDADWYALLTAMERSDLIDDPRFLHVAERRANVAEVESIVGAWVKQRLRDDVVETLQRHTVVCGPVLSIEEMLQSPQLRARGMLTELETPTGEQVPNAVGFGLPVRFVDNPLTFDQPAPVLGEHNDEVFRELAGFDRDDLARLRKLGIV
ncbi:MAG: crotonobetainyl-CoA:carnitine CoA-transferase CaiB-like acyl-CoA transferase [Gammaproteobacteria bacterium]|jgi:crotonobetainyl-CoA:carnitine CoA-transferase CaiB-like acyl-CoA transferase